MFPSEYKHNVKYKTQREVQNTTRSNKTQREVQTFDYELSWHLLSET